ncbi:MAG: PHP domain-containing protein [Longicatena sp.]
MRKIQMDLHMHTCYSNDGEYRPALLMQMCKEAKMDVVAIADHNTLEGISEAKQTAVKLGMEFIPGIELDCHIHGVNLHVLGYGIDEHNEALQNLSMNVRKMEQDNSQKQLDLVKGLGYYIDEDKAYKLSHHNVITGEILAEVALQDSRNDALMKDYLPGGSRSDNAFVNFYWDVCSQGKLGYVPITYITLEEAVDIIKNAGGIAILAHPGNNTKEDEDLLTEIFNFDVKGLEAYSSYHTKEQIAFYIDWANKHHVLISAGSDCHGKTKPAIHIGDTQCADTTPLYEAIREALK